MIESMLDSQTPSRAVTEKPAMTTRPGTSGIAGFAATHTHDTPAAVNAYDDFMEMSGPTGGVCQQQQFCPPMNIYYTRRAHYAPNTYICLLLMCAYTDIYIYISMYTRVFVCLLVPHPHMCTCSFYAYIHHESNSGKCVTTKLSSECSSKTAEITRDASLVRAACSITCLART